MVNQEIRTIIEELANKFILDSDLIEAEVITESSGNPKATRYEPGFYKRYIQPMKGLTPHEQIGRATSYGLMQIMGQVARENGFKGEFEELLEPAIGLEWALKHFSHFVNKYHPNINDAIAAYNAGSARIGKDGKYENQQYVDKVNKYLSQIKEERTDG